MYNGNYQMDTFTINSTVQKYSSQPSYRVIKERILYAQHTLSRMFNGTTPAPKLGQAYRNNSYTPDILSFLLEEHTGEVFTYPEVAKKEVIKFDLSETGHSAFPFIHGCLHLKGYDHGDTMEKLERKYCKAFDIS